MIFIRGLLTSIIFGSNSKNKVMGQMNGLWPFICQEKGQTDEQ